MTEKSQETPKNGAWIEIARVGSFKDSGGAAQTFTRERLDELAAGYDPDKREAPLVIGHPATDAPSYGWVKQLKVAGDKLLALTVCVSAEIKKMVDNKIYRYVSMSLFPDGGLRHVGLLGATPPAIDGLAPVSFSEGGEFIVINFAAHEESEKKGKEMNLEELARQLAELQSKLTLVNQELEAARTEAAEAKADLEKSRAGAEKTAAEFAAYVDEQEKKVVAGRIGKLVEDGRITPAERAAVEKTAEVLRQAGRLNFSSGGDENPLETFLASQESRPVSGLCGNFSAPPADGGGNETFGLDSLVAKL